MKKKSILFTLLPSTICALGLMTCVSNAKLPGTLSDGLVAYYPFTGNADNQASSLYGLALSPDASLTNNQTGAPNSAYYFSGDGGVGLQSTNNFPFLASITVSTWFNMAPSAPSNGRIVENFWGQGSWVISLNPSTLVLEGAFIPSDYDFTNLVRLNAPVALGQWYQVALTFDQLSGIASLYMNGAFVSSDSDILALRNNGDYPIQVGGVDERFVGAISDVTIYDRALSPTEVTTLYNTQSVPEPSTYALLLLSGAASLYALKRRKS